MAKLYVMVGLPGSGKSTWASQKGLPVHSSDSIRKELYGDEAIQGDGEKVFSILRKRIAHDLRAGQDCICDATNLTQRTRKQFAQWPGAKTVAVWVNTPLEECLRRNANRSRIVPENVIQRMAKNLTPPHIFEGFAQVIEV